MGFCRGLGVSCAGFALAQGPMQSFYKKTLFYGKSAIRRSICPAGAVAKPGDNTSRPWCETNPVFCAARAAIERHSNRFSRFGGKKTAAVLNGACNWRVGAFSNYFRAKTRKNGDCRSALTTAPWRLVEETRHHVGPSVGPPFRPLMRNTTNLWVVDRGTRRRLGVSSRLPPRPLRSSSPRAAGPPHL